MNYRDTFDEDFCQFGSAPKATLPPLPPVQKKSVPKKPRKKHKKKPPPKRKPKKRVALKKPVVPKVKTIAEIDLQPYLLPNGALDILSACKRLPANYDTVRAFAKKFGLQGVSRSRSQWECLEATSRALGGCNYVEEWRDPRLTNPSTGVLYRYDGFFPKYQLVVEFQGYQHYTFPSHVFPSGYKSAFDKMVESDKTKQKVVEWTQGLLFLAVRADEPFKDVYYLRGRLTTLGVSCPSPQLDPSQSACQCIAEENQVTKQFDFDRLLLGNLAPKTEV